MQSYQIKPQQTRSFQHQFQSPLYPFQVSYFTSDHTFVIDNIKPNKYLKNTEHPLFYSLRYYSTVAAKKKWYCFMNEYVSVCVCLSFIVPGL